MQRYFVKEENNNIIFQKDDIFHIKNVMRCKIGDYIECVSNDFVYKCEITSLNPFNFKIVEKNSDDRETDGFIRLFYCIPKGEKLDLVIQKSVELGVNELILVNSNRCVRKFDNQTFSSKLVRFNKIIKEASEQCKRSKLMKIDNLVNYKHIINYKSDISMIAYENSNSKLSDLDQILSDAKGKTINILVGSEGGFDKQEVDFAVNNGYLNITLGKRILRSETAVFYIISLISYYLEK